MRRLKAARNLRKQGKTVQVPKKGDYVMVKNIDKKHSIPRRKSLWEGRIVKVIDDSGSAIEVIGVDREGVLRTAVFYRRDVKKVDRLRASVVVSCYTVNKVSVKKEKREHAREFLSNNPLQRGSS